MIIEIGGYNAHLIGRAKYPQDLLVSFRWVCIWIVKPFCSGQMNNCPTPRQFAKDLIFLAQLNCFQAADLTGKSIKRWKIRWWRHGYSGTRKNNQLAIFQGYSNCIRQSNI